MLKKLSEVSLMSMPLRRDKIISNGVKMKPKMGRTEMKGWDIIDIE